MNNCTLCGLEKFSCPSCIRGSGPTDAKIMIVNGYATDLDEDKEEATMDGKIKDFFIRAGYDLKEVYYTNAIKCRAPKNYKLKVSEVKKCRVHLLEEIKRIKPKYVLLLGAQSCQAALDMKMSDLQGTPLVKEGITYYSTYSPRVIYYDAAKAPQVERELKVFLQLASGVEVSSKEAKLNTILITTMEEAKRACKDYKSKYKSVAYDIESTGLSRYTEKLTLFGFGNDKVQYQIPLNVMFSPLRYKPIAQVKIMQYVIKWISKFRNQIAANGKFDDLFLEEKYTVKPRITFDINLASHLLDENTPNGLKDSAVRELGVPNWDIGTSSKKGQVKTLKEYEQFCNYNGYDVYYSYKLYRHFRKKLRAQPNLWNIFINSTMKAARHYEDIERRGIPINMDNYNKSKKELTAKRALIELQLHDLIPKEFKKEYRDINWNSTKQVSQLLFDDIGLTPIDKTPTGLAQINESVLTRLGTPLTNKLVEYRGVATQIQTFVDGWGILIRNGKVHPSFILNGTVTGRISCKNPNLQQLPRDKDIRRWVDAPPGYTFLAADYSQLELRGVAIVSEERRMTELFKSGFDIHTNTGQTVTGKQDLTQEERKKAKAVNFGFVYGMGWRKFKDYARDSYGVILNDKEAKEFRTKFFNEYSDLVSWHAKQKKLVHYLGEVKNPIGRVRHLPDAMSLDQAKVAEAERQSINSPVQGFGADIAALALIEICETIPDKFYVPVGTVHDSIEGVCKTEYVEAVGKKIVEIMSNPRALKEKFKFTSEVPITADLEVGPFGSGMELDKWLETNKVPQKNIDWDNI